MSDTFTLIWGVHQGCPLSYTVKAEVPTIFIDADTRTKGVQIGDQQFKH